MFVLIRALAVSAILCYLPANLWAADLRQSLQSYFNDSAIQFGYGSGTSSSNPRVELTIHYCSSGFFYSSGQTCRPNLIATGYQCTPVQDTGRWQIVVQTGYAALQWASNSSGTGGVAVFLRADGSVVDSRGNPFYRVGPAQCT